MIIKRQLFRKVAVLGVGLMGGSLGLAMKKRGLAQRVAGLATSQETLDIALKNGAIDEGSLDPKKVLFNADLVVLAAPVEAIITMLPAINPLLRRGCIVTDLGSTKLSIVTAAQKIFPPTILYVGSHPLAGSEKKGPGAANADLFEGSTCIMTPTDKTNRLAKEKIKHLWSLLGANVRFLSPQEHDEILAYISHLPHLLAYSLMKTIPEHFLEYAAQGLKDTTRIASSDPKMWNDIFMSNSKNVLKSLDQTAKIMGSIRKSVVDKDEKTLIEIFRDAKTKRDKIH